MRRGYFYSCSVRKLLIILLFWIPSLLKAQEIRFTVSVSADKIGMQDFLQVQYLIENTTKVSSFVPPQFRSFRIVEGPGQTTGFNLENGNLKEYITFNYVLKAEKEGRWVIPAATARIDGKTYTSNSVSIEVVKGTAPMPSRQSLDAADEMILRPGENLDKKVRGNMFVKLEVSKRSVYVGEPVVASYKLYTRLRSESKVTRRPSFNGFSVYDMVNPDNEDATRELYQGKEYNVYLLRKVQLYPLQPGNLELEPLEVTNDVHFIRAEALDAGYPPAQILQELAAGVNNSGAIINQTFALQNQPVAIQVKALPLKADSAFTGAVGKFKIRTFTDIEEVHVNDVVNLQVQVAGEGNFPMIPVPFIAWPVGVDVFESSGTDQFNKFVAPLSGSKVFTVPFTPKKEGTLLIPAVKFVFFDVAAGRYDSVESSPLTLQVLGARPQGTGQVLAQTQEKPANTWKYILTVLGLLVVFGGLYVLLKRNSQPEKVLQPMPPAMPADKPEPAPQDPLEEIRQAFDRKDVKAFYGQLSLVIDQCMMNKYQVDTRGNWELQLLNKGVDASLVAEVKNLKQDAQLAMYTPFVLEGKMVEDLARIERIVC